MQIIQKVGPFRNGDIISIPSQQSIKYVHIGIQIPHRQPIAYVEAKPLSYEVTVNGTTYRINEKCILEFDELNERSFTIQMNEDLPWGTIFDILYDTTA